MKKILSFIVVIANSLTLCSQMSSSYPEPEFSNEVCLLQKDSIVTTSRLEKGSSRMEAKTKMGGFGGSENGYTLDGTKSPVRLRSGSDLMFVFSTGASIVTEPTAQDSIMRANGMDPSLMSGGMSSLIDPSSMINLYKAETGKGGRKIIMQKNPGAMPFSSKKIKSADKYTLSVKKVRNGYWLLVVDKPLPKGEYAFTIMSLGSPDGESTLFAFGID